MERLCAAVVACSGLLAAAPAEAHSTRQSENSVFATGSAVAMTMVMPVALSTHGAALVVRGVGSSARGIVCELERLSDGARASVTLAARGSGKASVGVGTVVTTTVTASGVLLSAAGEAVAFIPNQLGQALLHDERLTR